MQNLYNKAIWREEHPQAYELDVHGQIFLQSSLD